MLLQYLIISLQLLQLGSMAKAAASSADALPGCQDSCSNITVPYPFGIDSGCYAPGFKLTCNGSFNPPQLFIGTGNIRVTSISPDDMHIAGWIAQDCYDEPNSSKYVWIDIRATPYTFSYTRNLFTAVGCDAIALVYSGNTTNFTTGCMALCRDDQSVVNGSCAGNGCCQTSIPRGIKRFDSRLSTLYYHNQTASFSPCSYSFLIDKEEYEFKLSDFNSLREQSRVPVVLDWAVGNLTCGEARSSGKFLCGTNSNCSDSSNGPGYRCSCNKGYQGNPYLANGCQDINECADPNNNPCVDICTNTLGSYICSCSHDATGDGKREGSGCISPSKPFPLVKVVLGCGLGFLLSLVTGSLLYWVTKKRRMIQLRHRFFKQNGGFLLQQRIQSHQGAAPTFRIFTAEQLAKATDNYNQSRIIGRGGNGTVYKGILPDKQVVAIKKSMAVHEAQTDQFINEVVILSQVIHRNLVKILGCCLEAQVPLLVYEYISHGTLSHHLYGPGLHSSLSWESRLRIAVETARALAYLHSATSRPIIHRDVKTTNILLDERYTAKVADFGASRWVPLGRAHLTTMVQGTLGYLDPEYFQTGLLTEKSDVYSFGVVLVELLTGERPISAQRPEEERSLAMHFILSKERNQLFDILEPRVVNEGDRAQLEEVAELAERCLKLTGEERPKMKEVGEELERAKRFQRHPWAQEDSEEERSGLLRVPTSEAHTITTDRNEE